MTEPVDGMATPEVRISGTGPAIQRGCRDESFYQGAANFCLDTTFSPLTHAGTRCYRDIPHREWPWSCPAAIHVCFDADGNCEESPDISSIANEREADGSCGFNEYCIAEHTALDFAPAVAESAAEAVDEAVVEPLERGVSKLLDPMTWYRLAGLGTFAMKAEPAAAPAPADPAEREADAVAERVTSGGSLQGAAGPIRRACAACGGTNGNCSQCSRPAGGDPTAEPAIVEQVLASPGRPLEPAIRAWLEPRFGRDLGGVRIHTDRAAAASARALRAEAYTVGQHIAFESGRYAPGTDAGRRLLAHELTHTIQQAPLTGSEPGSPVQRKPDEPAGVAGWWEDSPPIDIDSPDAQKHLQSLSRKELLALLKWVREPRARLYIERLAVPEAVARNETGAVELKHQDVDRRATPSTWGGYWAKRVLGTYHTTQYSPVESRFKASPNERDAVLEGFWQVRPGSMTQGVTKRIVVTPAPAPGAGLRVAQAVHYRFELRPSSTGPPDLDIHFEREVPVGQARHALPGAGYDAFEPSNVTLDAEVNFPEGDAKTYWRRHPQEHKKLFYWIERTMQGDIDDQEVVVDGVAYQVTARKNARGKPTFLDVQWLGRDYREHVVPRRDPEKQDVVDFQLEQLRDPTTKGGPLGDLILDEVPADEIFSVKYAIWQNFGAGLRNREVDTLVPIALTKRRVFYTLRFRPNNDVEAQRLDEEGSSVAFSPDQVSIQRAHGYPAEADDVGVHQSWLKTRYKALAATGSTPQELQQNADAELARRARTPDWLADNYGMKVLEPSAADARLGAAHKLAKPARAGLKTFTGTELVRIEQGLQPLSDAFVRRLRLVRLIRQTKMLEPDGTPLPGNQQPGAETLFNGDKFSIRFFDRWRPTDQTFMGATSGITHSAAGLVIHEAGHVLEQKLGLRRSFNALVAKLGSVPFTDYAASNPDSEMFPEALKIYELDPQWLRATHPEIFDWIEKHGGA